MMVPYEEAAVTSVFNSDTLDSTKLHPVKQLDEVKAGLSCGTFSAWFHQSLIHSEEHTGVLTAKHFWTHHGADMICSDVIVEI